MAEVNRPLVDPDKIVRDVHNLENISAKTELNIVQIESINKLNTLSFLFQSDFLYQHLKDFQVLQKSKDRKSMGEFVEALKSKKDELVSKAKSFSLIG